MNEITNETSAGTYAVCGEAYAEPQATAAYADTGEYAEIYLAEADIGENPKVNLATGRLTYVQPDVAIGGGNYEINVAHIYSSQPNGKLSPYIKGMGKGWKLNVQQCLIRDGSGLAAAYKYIDSAGEVHSFASFDENKYYDNANAGTVLDTSGSMPYIADGTGNKMYFNADGRIVRSVSGQNDKIAKTYDYDSLGRLAQVYDERNMSATLVSQRIGFEYGADTGLLSAVTVYDNFNNKVMSLLYEYDGEQLTRITKAVMGVKKSDGSQNTYCSKTLTEFAYSLNGALEKIVDKETNTALVIEYTGNRVQKLRRGIIIDGGACAGAKDAAGAQLYFGGRKDAGGNTLGLGSPDRNEFREKSHVQFAYNDVIVNGLSYSNETDVTNDKDVTLAYFIDRKMRIVSNLEKSSGFSFKTLTKESDKKIEINGGGSQTVNGSAYRSFSGTFVVGTLNIVPARSKAERKNKYLSCSFWLRHYQCSERMKVRLQYTFKKGAEIQPSRTAETYIDGYAYGAWQKVSALLIAPEIGDDDNDSVNNILESLSVTVLKADNSAAGTCQFCHLYFSSAPKTGLILRQNTTDSYLEDADTSSIVRYGSLPALKYNNKTSEEVYFTDSDVVRSVTNKYSQPYVIGDKTCFDIICNNGTKRIGKATHLQFKIGSTTWNPYNDNWPIKMRVITPDNKSLTDQAYIYSPDSFRVRTDVLRYPNGTASAPDGSSRAETQYDYKGKKLSEKDEYGVKTEYVYDDCGNLIRTRLVSGDGKQEKTAEIHYDERREYVETESAGLSSVDHISRTPFGLPGEVIENDYCEPAEVFSRSRRKIVTDYDIYNDKVIGIKEYDGAAVARRADVTYHNGRLRTVSDGTVKFGVESDDINDKITYTQYAGVTSGTETVLQTERLIKGTAANNYADKVETVYNRGSAQDRVETTADKYGRPDSIRLNGTETAKYRYHSGAESAGAQLLYTYKDNFEARTTTFEYDPDGNLIKWTKGNNHLTVQNIGGGDKYTFGANEKYFTHINYDPDKSLNPRILSTKVSYDPDSDNDDDLSEMYEYGRNYSYDSLGRLTKKTGGYKYSTFKNFDNIVSYEYEDGHYASNLIKRQTSDIADFSDHGHSGTKTVYNYTYNIKEQLIGSSVSASFSFIAGNVTSNYTYSNNAAYNYDDHGRMIAETNDKLGINRTYLYNSDGKLQSISGTNPKTCAYDSKGRLKNFGATTYSYDNYGNRINKSGTAYTYTRGNLLASAGGAVYYYNTSGVRFKKIAQGVATDFYLDGTKILGEDRGVTKLRYFYDANGLCGIRNGSTNYSLVLDALGSVSMIANEGAVVARYVYDAWGNHKVLNADGTENTSPTFIGNINPFRWKGHYFDAESALYYIGGRYYDPECGNYLDAADVSAITAGAFTVGGLDRNGTMCDNIHELLPYIAAIFTTLEMRADPDYDPNENKPWWEMIWIWIGEFFAQIAKKFDELHWSVKVLLGIDLFLLALIMTIATHGAVLPLFIGMAVGIGFEVLKGGIDSAENGGGFWEGAFTGFIDGVFWGGVFAFVTASVQAIKSGIATIRGARSSTGMCCFEAGTPVLTEAGYKLIEEIGIGDKVLAYDEGTGEREYKEVVRLFRNKTREWCHVYIEGQEEPIVSTPGHKYYLPENEDYREINEQQEHEGYNELSIKWVSARNLQTGDKVMLCDGRYGIVSETSIERLAKPETTYNFEVEGFHTYYVGENGVCVHNACRPNIEKTVPEGYKPTYENGVFDPNPKHGMVQHGKSSARISSADYGQYALDKSIAVKGSRMSYNGKNFLVFKTHNPGAWHGYITNYAGLIGRQAQINAANWIFNVWR